jgi:uncharacterized membrane protein
MASFKKTYDTDSIVLRRIFAVNPDTNGRISANTFLVTGANGLGSFQDAVSFLSTISVPTSLVAGTGITVTNTNGTYTIATDGSSSIAPSDLISTTKGLGSLGYLSTIANLGQIFNSTFLVAGTNITFSSNANQITINGQAGGGGDIAASDLTSTTMGLGTLGYLSTQQLTSTTMGLGSLGYLSSTQLASTIANLGQIYNSTILVAGTNITFSSNANEITINGQAGGGGLAASDLTSTTMGLGLLGYLSTSQLASTIVNLGQIYNSTILVAGTNITFNSNANEITINSEGGGGGDVTALNLTSTTMGLGLLGYLSTTQLASAIVNLGQIYNSTILVAGTNITFSSNANEITINGQAGGGGGDVTVTNLTSTSIGLGSLGYLSSPSIFNSGNVYYLNWSQAGPTYPYKALQPTVTNGGLQFDTTAIPANSEALIQTFQTSTILPLFIPSGIWDLNLFVNTTSSYIKIYYKLYKLNSGTSTLIATSPSSFIIPSDDSTVQISLSEFVQYTPLTSGDTLYIEIYGINTNLLSPQSVTVNYENGKYSHLHTTFLQSVTEFSTIQGLGSLGYLSSFNTISSLNISSGSIYASLLSSQQITASSIRANNFVGDGSLITNVPNLGVTSITAGTGIGLDTTTGAVTLSNTGVRTITQGDGISITGSDGSFTITATGGTAGTVAAADLVSTTISLLDIGTSNLTSTSKGLGSVNYLSSFATISSLNISTGSIYASLLSSQQITVSSIRANMFVGDGSLLVNVPGTGGLATIDLTSTVIGLGTSGYLSSLTLLSTIENLGQIYNSTILVAGTNITFSSNINQITINGQAGGGGGLAASDLTSTTMGLGSISYISSFNTLSSLNISSGSIYTSTTSTTETNAGRLNFGELYNNGTKLVDAYGNILFSFQTL